ncbi:hypothetical protein G7Y89_g8594 [Cudoniella acicularis]|uniref:F-box domain-containing protein n=1 Tax=Cudoniella acicularis TaxID=354080 RepID=A0A8H4W3E8_9HELO|nr:hypothetical protein G7Y89_g8594 [Cudoniella acicularis]
MCANAFVPRFESLPRELREQVMLQCNTTDLLSFARTSKRIHLEAIPIIYRWVDLSCHNQARQLRGLGNILLMSSNICNDLLKKQRIFINTILEHPYGIYVSAFTWTHLTIYFDLDRSLEHPGGDSLWKAFQSMQRVEFIDIGCSCKDQNLVIPPALFPAAKSLRIGGQMSYAFLRSILATSPSTITSLELDNLIGIEQISDGESLSNSHLQWWAWLKLPDSEDANGHPCVRHAGPMNGHLYQLVGRFSRLQNLTIRTSGHEDWSINGKTAGESTTVVEKENKIYHEIASFIKSTHLTIESLVIEHAIPMEKYPTYYDHSRMELRARQSTRTIDETFLRHIAPALLLVTWPKLKRLTIKGIGDKPEGVTEDYSSLSERDPSILRGAKQQLVTALGLEVLVTWDAPFC